MLPFITDLTAALASHGFRPVADPHKTVPGAEALLKRQTWNTNRAVIVVSLSEVPTPFDQYLAELRKRVALRCRFVPFFYGLGMQVVLAAPGIAKSGIKPSDHVALVDNQWAIVQSLFLVEMQVRRCVAFRSWGQFVTGKVQDAITDVLASHFSHIQDAGTDSN